MRLLHLYKWIAGTMSDFTKPFQNEDMLFNRAQSFWKHLESSSIITLLLFIVLGIAFAVFYYLPYNEKPGRHYKPLHWLIFLAVTFGVTFLATFGFEYFTAKPVLQGAMLLEIKIALGNAIYASLLYFVVSLIWCNALPTNAYRIFKFK